MLQTTKPPLSALRREAPPGMISGADVFELLIGFMRRQLPIILFVTVLITALGVIHLVTTRPSYMAQAQMMIDARKMQIFQQQSILGDAPIDTAQVESQVEVLKSENVAEAVIKNLHLTEDPEFMGGGGGLIGSVTNLIFGFITPSTPAAPPSEYELSRRAMDAFRSRLQVSRVGLTYVISISFQSFNAERAAEIVNAVADAYIVDQLDAKYKATRRASSWLQDRIKELRDQVSTAERAVVDFKASNNIVNTGSIDKPLLGQQQVTELSSQLTITRAQTAEARARLDRITSVLKPDEPDALGATVTDTLKNEIVTKLRTQYLELAAREADWSVKYGKNHLAVISIRNQMREIRSAIFEELKRLGETYKSDYEIAKQREEGVQKELDRAVALSQETDARTVTLRELQSTAQTYKSLYDNFLQRYMEAVQQQSFPMSESRLISPASRPLGKSSPNAVRILGLACFVGLFLGVGIGMLRELSDRVIRSSEQVENLLHVDCVALVPAVKGGRNAAVPAVEDPTLHQAPLRRREKPEAGGPSGEGPAEGWAHLPQATLDASLKLAESARSPGHAIARGGDALWTVVDVPLSRYTEAIRSIKLANDLAGNIKANRVLGLTSSLPNEGKSTLAFSLGQLMAQVGARTILLDCDLRNPSLSRSLAPRAKAGMIEVITGKMPLEEALWEDAATGLQFLPAVVKFRLTHSMEVLSSPATKEFFERLREEYDYVIVDLPPLAPIVDVRATTHLVDSFLFVIEWGRTKIDIVEHALAHAPGVYDNLLGVVLNKVDMGRLGRYAGHREGYFYNEHYSRYGYTE